jgi:hypothetical protein
MCMEGWDAGEGWVEHDLKYTIGFVSFTMKI